MKVKRHTCWAVLALTLFTALVPAQLLVAGDPIHRSHILTPMANTPSVKDVELAAGGVLSGQVIDTAGRPLVGQTILALQSNREPLTTQADHEGQFRLSGLTAGLCQINYGEQAIACRCWVANTAPPIATKELLLTAGDSVQRGQRPIADLLTGPILIGMLIGAAIAIPIAIHNSKKDAS